METTIETLILIEFGWPNWVLSKISRKDVDIQDELRKNSRTQTFIIYCVSSHETKKERNLETTNVIHVTNMVQCREVCPLLSEKFKGF